MRRGKSQKGYHKHLRGNGANARTLSHTPEARRDLRLMLWIQPILDSNDGDFGVSQQGLKSGK
jgi:hypothetical protein